LADEQASSFRLFLAERALADGVAPSDLLKACRFDSGSFDLLKAGYNLRQPRGPKGNPDGGQWSSDDGGTSPAERRITFADYKVIKEPPGDAKVAVPRDGVGITAGDPTTPLIAPRHANYRQVSPPPRRSPRRRYPSKLHLSGKSETRRHIRFSAGSRAPRNAAGLCQCKQLVQRFQIVDML